MAEDGEKAVAPAGASAAAEGGGDVKEEESVKLFVGQVPKHMTEPELLAMFREVAAVDEVTVIKDKATKVSRGADPYARIWARHPRSRFLGLDSAQCWPVHSPESYRALPSCFCLVRVRRAMSSEESERFGVFAVTILTFAFHSWGSICSNAAARSRFEFSGCGFSSRNLSSQSLLYLLQCLSFCPFLFEMKSSLDSAFLFGSLRESVHLVWLEFVLEQCKLKCAIISCNLCDF